MIKNILFDMGGVIIPIEPKNAIARFKEIGLEDADKRLDSYTQQGIFGEVEEGKISAEDFRAALSELCGRELTWKDCQYAWLGYLLEVPRRNLDTLLRLRKEGYRVILLSNTNPFIMNWVMDGDFDGEGNGLGHYLDAAYMSYKCGAMKPADKFFNHVIESEGLNPDETLFLDDGKRNIEAAEALGIRTYLVANGTDWTQEIYSYL